MITDKKGRRIKQIVVSKLFGTFDYTIPLREEGTTILVGPSGFGKTIILKLLTDLFGKSDHTLRTIPFAEFRVDFFNEDEERAPQPSSFWVTKEKEQATLTYHFSDKNGQEQSFAQQFPSTAKFEAECSFALSIGDQPVKDAQYEKELLPFEEALEQDQEKSVVAEHKDQVPEWLVAMRQAVPIHLVGPQRSFSLLRMGKQNGSSPLAMVVPTAKVYAEELAVQLRAEQQDLSDFAHRVERLQASINKLFLYKKMTLSKENGVVFTDANGFRLAPQRLSLGEQHLFILLYELLFKVQPGTLVLVDEPEISLHIVWLKDFLRTLWGIAGISEVDLLIVTHSPDFIHDRWDMVVPLEKVA